MLGFLLLTSYNGKKHFWKQSLVMFSFQKSGFGLFNFKNPLRIFLEVQFPSFLYICVCGLVEQLLVFVKT